MSSYNRKKPGILGDFAEEEIDSQQGSTGLPGQYDPPCYLEPKKKKIPATNSFLNFILTTTPKNKRLTKPPPPKCIISVCYPTK